MRPQSWKREVCGLTQLLRAHPGGSVRSELRRDRRAKAGRSRGSERCGHREAACGLPAAGGREGGGGQCHRCRGGGVRLNRQVGKGEKQLRGKGDFTPTECEVWGRAGWTRGFEGQWHKKQRSKAGRGYITARERR